MANPIYFYPDPEIPDADLLGFGDIEYDDGSIGWLNGDPETAALIKSYQDVLPSEAKPGSEFRMRPEPQGAPAPQRQSLLQTPGGPISAPTSFSGSESVGKAGTQLLDTIAPGKPGSERHAAVQARAAEGAAAQAPPAPSVQPFNMEQDARMRESAGSTLAGTPPSIAAPPPPAPEPQAMPLTLTQVTGRIPEGMAAEQRAATQEQNQSLLGAEQQSRDAQWALMRQDIQAQRNRIAAELQVKQEEERKAQAKAARLKKEQAQLSSMPIADDLASAAGEGGKWMMIIGSALLGAIGQDTGLRMIEKKIDQHVRNQINRRDSRLRTLADELGSEEQVIQHAKADIYRLLGERATQLQQLTRADAFMAQTPAVMEALKAKQLEAEQARDRESLGKPVEQLMLPKSQELDPGRFERYGKVRRDRTAAEQMAARGEKEIGLIWDPAIGDYANRAEVMARGIQGKGNLESWLPNWVYSTFGGVTEEGYQVRGVAESMAYAQIRQMQPTGPISNADIRSAIKAGALDTEEGLVEGLRRIRSNSQTEATHDAAQFGPEVVQEYERRLQQSGGSNVNTAGSPGASRPATLDDLVPQGQQAPQAQGEIPEDPKERIALVHSELQGQAGQELPPEGINILVAQFRHETADGAKMPKGNAYGHKAVGEQASVELETAEGAGDEQQRVKQKFRTFDSLGQSVAAHISLIKRKYPSAWEALQSGDEMAYVAALKDGGYFTDSEDVYLRGIQRRL